MRQDLEQRKKEMNESVLKNQKQNVRNQIVKKSIEAGVKPLNCKQPLDDRIKRTQPDPDAPIYEYGMREKDLIRERKIGLLEIVYFDLDQEELVDQAMVKNLFKKYRKALKFNFWKYANTGFNQKEAHCDKRLFDEIKDKNEQISIPEMWRLIKDYDFECIKNDRHFIIHQIFTVEENKTLFRLVNLQGLKKKNETQDLDFEGFLLYLINFAYIVGSRAPANLGHLPLGYSVQYVIDKMKEKTENNRQSTILYEEIESAYFGESEIIKNYNKQLESTPDLPLP